MTGTSPPRVVVRADVRPALRVAGVVALLGLPFGAVWSLLAPPVRAEVRPGGAVVALLQESEHRFDALGLFVLLGFAFGVLVGVAVWMLRSRRGPVVLLGAVLGSIAGGLLAMWFGQLLAGLAYPTPADAAPGMVVTSPPMVDSVWSVVAAPFAIALTVSGLVAWNGADDLDRRDT